MCGDHLQWLAVIFFFYPSSWTIFFLLFIRFLSHVQTKNMITTDGEERKTWQAWRLGNFNEGTGKNDTARRAFTILICYLFNDILMNVLSF